MKQLCSSTDRNISESKKDLQMDIQTTGLNKALSSGAKGSTESVVKAENQAHLDLKQEITVVQAMKTSLEKEEHKAETLWNDFKAEDKPEVRSVLDNMGKVFTEVKTFLSGIRKLLVDAKALDTDTDKQDLQDKI